MSVLSFPEKPDSHPTELRGMEALVSFGKRETQKIEGK